MNRLLISTTYLILCVFQIQAQHIRVQGMVSDEEGLPIAYANIGIEGANYGTVSNLEGGFDIFIRKEDAEKQIAISFVGYNTAHILIDTSVVNQIVLKTQDVELPSAFILGFEPNELITKFNHNKSSNYPHTPLVHKVFLREHEKVSDGSDIYLNELRIDYLREDYSSSKKDKMRIVKGRNFHYLNFDSTGYSQPVGGLFDIKHDLVKYPNNILSSGKNNYHYTVESAYEDGDRLVYKVKFTSASKRSKYKGYLYIEDQSFALVKAEISYDEEGMKWLNHGSWSADVKWKSMKKTIYYNKMDNGKFQLSEIIIEGQGKNFTLDEDIESLTELVVIETKNKNIETSSFMTIDKHIVLGDLDFKNSPNFWEGNNHIKREKLASNVSSSHFKSYFE